MKQLINFGMGFETIAYHDNLEFEINSLCEFNDICTVKSKGDYCITNMKNCEMYKYYERYGNDLNYLGVGS